MVRRNHRIPLRLEVCNDAGCARGSASKEGDCERLAAVVADRNSRQKHVWRAQIILATAEGCGPPRLCAAPGSRSPCVWRSQERFMREGVAGLLHDKTSKPGLPPLPSALIDRVVELTLAEPPGEATHWTGRAMAAASGISLRSVQRIWAAHGLQPHRVRRFKLSQDPAFAAKLRDVVGLYLDPPAHSLVLSVDEKSQIQALDRTQPGLPMKRGRAGTMTHDYIRNLRHDHLVRGTQRPRRQGHRAMHGAPSPPGIHPLSEPDRGRGASRQAHSRDPRQLRRPQASQSARLARPPSALDLSFHPDLVLLGQCRRRLFRHPTRRRLQRGVFRSLVDLQAAINRYLGEHNRKPKPFVWTADPDRIIEKVNRGYQVIASDHSHVRLFQYQANESVAFFQALTGGCAGQGRKRGRHDDG